MNFWQKVQAVWGKLTLLQRVTLVTVMVTVALVGAVTTRWAMQPEFRLLYRDLSAEEAAKIVDKISEKGISYQLRNGGTSIYVPREHVYQLRLDMAREGLPSSDQAGYKLFDKERIGISPFVQNVNLKRALEEELAKSIQMINGVVHARVHIVNSEQKLFASEADKTTASVVLQLKPGYKLSPLNIAAITHMVAGSVEGLTAENVTVIDSNGNLLSSQSNPILAAAGGTVQDYRERVERNLAKKVEEMLTTVLGPQRAAVSVSAVVDMNSVSTVTETYQPRGAVKKEEITSGSETTPATGSGTGQGAAAGKTRKDETVITEYELGKTVKQQTSLPGKVVSLKVAAFVDLSITDPNGSEKKIMQVSDVQEIIKNALGLEDTSSIKVVDVKFNRPLEKLVEEEPSKWPRYLALVRQASLGIMALCAVVVFWMFRGAAKKARTEAESEALPSAAGSGQMLPAPSGGVDTAMVRRQIANALERNPEQVKRLFASWIQEKVG